MMVFFDYAQLPVNLQIVARPFHELAERTMTWADNSEMVVCLRKLLEARDAAFRAVAMGTK